MSNFTPKVKFVTDFDGDTISMQLARLKRKHVAVIAPFMKGVDADGSAVVEFSNQVEFSNAMMSVLPEVVSDFGGHQTFTPSIFTMQITTSIVTVDPEGPVVRGTSIVPCVPLSTAFISISETEAFRS